jgi:hypothetical protein
VAVLTGQTDLEADRQVANTLAELIIGGSLISPEITRNLAGIGGHESARVSLR